MPELPEVETIERDLSRLIVGKKILDITTDSPKQVQPSLGTVKKAVVGRRIVGMKRRAKVLIIELGSKADRKQSSAKTQKRKESAKFFLTVHLKLTGRLLFRDKSDSEDKWTRVVISLSGGKELRFADLRKFGWIKLVNSNQLSVMSDELGVEPFDKEFTIKYLHQVFSKTSRPIKVVLLDQKRIAGVGNIYTNDALFLAKIRPDKPAKKLSYQAIKQLRKAIIKVLKAGIKYRGASNQYYLDALGHKGAYQDHFLVYGRDDKKCFGCKSEVKRIKLGGRGTFYCPKCQR